MELVEQANKALMEIATEVRSVQNLIAKISTLNSSQATSLAEIDVAMKNINQVTVQSMASTKQAEKAAQNLTELSRKLAETLQAYRVN